MRYVFSALRYVLWAVAEFLRRLRRPPDYVVFILEGAYPELRPPRAGFLRKRLFPDRFSLQELGEQFQAVRQDPRVAGVTTRDGLILLRISGLQAFDEPARGVPGRVGRARGRAETL